VLSFVFWPSLPPRAPCSVRRRPASGTAHPPVTRSPGCVFPRTSGTEIACRAGGRAYRWGRIYDRRTWDVRGVGAGASVCRRDRASASYRDGWLWFAVPACAAGSLEGGRLAAGRASSRSPLHGRRRQRPV